MKSSYGAVFVSLLLTLPAARAAEPEHIAIIPAPAALSLTAGSFQLGRDTVIRTDAASHSSARMLSRALSVPTGYDFNISEGRKSRNNAIVLATDAKLGRLGDEGCVLEVTPRRITIRATTPAGVFHGTQTLRQLLPPEIYSPVVRSGVAWRVPCLRIEDSPRFAWRGALVDVARHFLPKADLFRFLDSMAILKLNTLQLHLTDNQGWRVEIRKYPRLTEWTRRQTLAQLREQRDAKGQDVGLRGDYYTQDDLRQLVAYAAERHITVVPEIEMPGHAGAAVAAWPELGNLDTKLNPDILKSRPLRVFNANESTIQVLQDIISEVMEIFPSKFIHIGGDEARKVEWKLSAAAQQRMRELGLKNEDELQSYFIRRMDQFLASRGRRLIGWDEILEGGLAPGATLMPRRGTEGGIAAVRAGHDVVRAQNDFTYFDHYQSRNPEEPLAIGNYLLPLEKVYQFEPVPPELSPAEARHILGVQGQHWAEYIPTLFHLEYMAFPRLAALAEVAWTPAARRDYAAFTGRLQIQQQRWRISGVNFRR
jgi:hexosaminidase